MDIDMMTGSLTKLRGEMQYVNLRPLMTPNHAKKQTTSV